MVKDLYQKSFSVLMKRPFRLWGLSLLAGVLLLAAQVGFVGVPAVAFCAALLLTLIQGLLPKGKFRSYASLAGGLILCWPCSGRWG